MMTFHLHLKRISKPKHKRLKFDIEKLKDPNVLEIFQAMIGGKFAPLTIMANIVRRKKPGSLHKFLSVQQSEGSEKYKKVNNNIKRCMKKAKENWIGEQYEIEENLWKNNSKRVDQLMKDLTTVKQGKATAVKDCSGKCLTEEHKILNQWTEYC